jgi:SAM-dependent methyltransferase
MSDVEIKQQVSQFYDQIGWQMVGDGSYQNARYEDLRPVAHEYIHRCHLRVGRHLPPTGKYLLDAGSGPVQYPEYQTYSQNYQYRVCADISLVALEEARKRLGEKGLYVVADVAHLPFHADAFEGIVSLHTLHHLPASEQTVAYLDLYRVLAPGGSAVIVNGWTDSVLMRRMGWLVKGMEGLARRLARLRAKEQAAPAAGSGQTVEKQGEPLKSEATGTFIQKRDAEGLRRELQGKIEIDIRVWRSVSVRFLRAVVHGWAGKLFLRFLFSLEERFPRYFGEKGQYPLVLFKKSI